MLAIKALINVLTILLVASLQTSVVRAKQSHETDNGRQPIPRLTQNNPLGQSIPIDGNSSNQLMAPQQNDMNHQNRQMNQHMGLPYSPPMWNEQMGPPPPSPMWNGQMGPPPPPPMWNGQMEPQMWHDGQFGRYGMRGEISMPNGPNGLGGGQTLNQNSLPYFPQQMQQLPNQYNGMSDQLGNGFFGRSSNQFSASNDQIRPNSWFNRQPNSQFRQFGQPNQQFGNMV